MVQKVKIKIKAILEQLENILRVGNLNKYDWWKDRVCSSWGRAGYEKNLKKNTHWGLSKSKLCPHAEQSPLCLWGCSPWLQGALSFPKECNETLKAFLGKS